MQTRKKIELKEHQQNLMNLFREKRFGLEIREVLSPIELNSAVTIMEWLKLM
jgi:hypothetical protein